MLEQRNRSDRWTQAAGWTVLAGALAAVLVLALRFDPGLWPTFVGDEPTYLAAAQSLAHDFDLRFEGGDLQRFEHQAGGRRPEALILQSPDGGATVFYSKPWIYPLLIAPAVRLAGHQGAIVWQGLLFALGAVLLVRRMHGEWQHLAPWVVLLWLFGSVTFAQVFWLHADLALAGLVATGLAFGLRQPTRWQGPRMAQGLGGERDSQGRGAVVLGAFLVVLAATARPFYAALLLPLWLDRRDRGQRVGLAAGVVVALLLTLGFNYGLQRSWSAYGAERLGFTPETGFPLAAAARPTGGDAAAAASRSSLALEPTADGPTDASAAWQAAVAARGSNAWAGAEQTLPFGFDFAEARWNSLYLLFGRHVGLLPYFAGPLLLGLLACGGGWRRGGALWLAFLVVAAAFLITRPFNFWGGGGSLANRYLLPAIPALWFAGSRRIHGVWLLVVGVVAALFLAPLWRQPAGYLLNDDATYRFVSSTARARLPYETTQSSLKPAGREDFLLAEGPHQLWAKPLSSSLVPEEFTPGRARRLSVDPKDHGGHLLVADLVPLKGMTLEVADGPRRGDKTWVELRRPRARHRMWWSSERMNLYEVDLAGGLRELEIEERTTVRLRWRFAER